MTRSKTKTKTINRSKLRRRHFKNRLKQVGYCPWCDAPERRTDLYLVHQCTLRIGHRESQQRVFGKVLNRVPLGWIRLEASREEAHNFDIDLVTHGAKITALQTYNQDPSHGCVCITDQR